MAADESCADEAEHAECEPYTRCIVNVPELQLKGLTRILVQDFYLITSKQTSCNAKRPALVAA